jgi:hypothetical protein
VVAAVLLGICTHVCFGLVCVRHSASRDGRDVVIHGGAMPLLLDQDLYNGSGVEGQIESGTSLEAGSECWCRVVASWPEGEPKGRRTRINEHRAYPHSACMIGRVRGWWPCHGGLADRRAGCVGPKQVSTNWSRIVSPECLSHIDRISGRILYSEW